ncbi:MAG: hypothetical protein ACF788_05985 [Novipirellula sp. JB048]
MKCTRLFALFCMAIGAIGSANAQDQAAAADGSVPDGSAAQISDWALAGVIWSDASLTKKLARQAATEASSPQQAAQFERLFQQSSRIVDAMETFGWRQVKRAGQQTSQRAGQRAGNLDHDRSSADAAPAALGERSERQPQSTPPATLAPSLKRFDTETPAGRDDPGLDDERIDDGLPLDLDNYRVDDFIDETPAEARNRADAIEDGVEGAIAAASGRLGIGNRGTDRISYRETQTRSTTLPYAQDSIYDADDYDPDVDYDVDHPLGGRSTDRARAERGDHDDDINLDAPAKVIDGEDELLAAMARERQAAQQAAGNSASVAGTTTRQPLRTDLNRYTDQRSKYEQDANWVQFHLDANQAVWTQFTTRENLHHRLSDSLIQLRADVSVALQATDNERLKSILSQVRLTKRDD